MYLDKLKFSYLCLSKYKKLWTVLGRMPETMPFTFSFYTGNLAQLIFFMNLEIWYSVVPTLLHDEMKVLKI